MGRDDFTAEAEARRAKRDIRAPCMYKAWNEVQRKDTEFYPAVDCDCECSHCGWNPEVAARRIARLKERMQGGGTE